MYHNSLILQIHHRHIYITFLIKWNDFFFRVWPSNRWSMIWSVWTKAFDKGIWWTYYIYARAWIQKWIACISEKNIWEFFTWPTFSLTSVQFTYMYIPLIGSLFEINRYWLDITKSSESGTCIYVFLQWLS